MLRRSGDIGSVSRGPGLASATSAALAFAIVLGLAPETAIPTALADTPDSAVRLRCRDVIGSTDDPSPGHAVVFGRVALPTRIALQASPSGEDDSNARLFAKDGLLIKPRASFELIVPDAWRDRLTLGWSGAERTAHLKVQGCDPNRSPRTTWLAYAGGYWVRDPACVSVIVKAAHKSRRVRIGVGAPCPGQDPPPPAPVVALHTSTPH